MISIGVRHNIQNVRVKLMEFRTDVVNKAIPSALNKTASAARTQAVRTIRQKIKNMKAARIRKRISIIRATRTNQVAVIRGRAAVIPPGAFKIPGHGETLYVHVGPKHRQIVSKSGKSFGKRISSGYQIAPVQSVQVIEQFAKQNVQEVMKRVVRERFPIIFERELKFYGRK